MVQWGEIDLIAEAVPAVLSGVALALITLTAKRVVEMARRFEVLAKSQRDDHKAHIVEIYERACRRGWISPMELDVANSRADSYFGLDGNHYIKGIMKRLNEDMEIRGEAIPRD